MSKQWPPPARPSTIAVVFPLWLVLLAVWVAVVLLRDGFAL
jgi:hypothetical protein